MQYQIEIYNKMFDCAQPTAITLDSRHVEMENQFLQPESSIPRTKGFSFQFHISGGQNRQRVKMWTWVEAINEQTGKSH